MWFGLELGTIRFLLELMGAMAYAVSAVVIAQRVCDRASGLPASRLAGRVARVSFVGLMLLLSVSFLLDGPVVAYRPSAMGMLGHILRSSNTL
jgi:hypothetical protein